MVSGNDSLLLDSLPEEETDEAPVDASESLTEDEAYSLYLDDGTPDTETVSGNNAGEESVEESADGDEFADEEALSTSSGDNITVSGGDYVTGSPADVVTVDGTGLEEYYTELLEVQNAILVSEQRQELQLEACISILLFFAIYGALVLIYKFFRLFI